MSRKKRIDHSDEQRAANERRVTQKQRQVVEHGKQQVYEQAIRNGFTEKEARRFAGL